MEDELSTEEQTLLQALLKGPALPFELAARTLSFPDEVTASIRTLVTKGLVEVEPVTRGIIGGDMVILSAKGVACLEQQGA